MYFQRLKKLMNITNFTSPIVETDSLPFPFPPSPSPSPPTFPTLPFLSPCPPQWPFWLFPTFALRRAGKLYFFGAPHRPLTGFSARLFFCSIPCRPTTKNKHQRPAHRTQRVCMDARASSHTRDTAHAALVWIEIQNRWALLGKGEGESS